MLAFLLPEIVIKMAYMMIEEFLLSGIVSSTYCRKGQVVAEQANSRGELSYSTINRSIVNGEGVHWEKGEGGSQNKTISSLIYVCDAL